MLTGIIQFSKAHLSLSPSYPFIHGFPPVVFHSILQLIDTNSRAAIGSGEPEWRRRTYSLRSIRRRCGQCVEYSTCNVYLFFCGLLWPTQFWHYYHFFMLYGQDRHGYNVQVHFYFPKSLSWIHWSISPGTTSSFRSFALYQPSMWIQILIKFVDYYWSSLRASTSTLQGMKT
jgi:hypothetical protein